MKGITPVIAIILLLLITISMVGFAFVWFTRFVEIAGSATENATISEVEKIKKTVRIDNAGTGGVTVRNTGSANIPVNEISVYIDGSAISCSWTGSIAPQGSATCTQAVCSSGQEAKVTSPGTAQDVVTC